MTANFNDPEVLRDYLVESEQKLRMYYAGEFADQMLEVLKAMDNEYAHRETETQVAADGFEQMHDALRQIRSLIAATDLDKVEKTKGGQLKIASMVKELDKIAESALYDTIEEEGSDAHGNE